MMDLAVDRRQNQDRVTFHHSIRILSPDRRRSLRVQAVNLGLSGIFVKSNELFAVGTELLIDLPVPVPDPGLALRGRVAWLTRFPEMGMGLQFIDLTESDMHALKRLVAEKIPLDCARPVTIWFDGLAHATLARATPCPEGLRVLVELPHLRQHSEVFFHFGEQAEESHSGFLNRVSLLQSTEEGFPALEAFIQFRSAADCTWTAWPPPAMPGLEPPLPDQIHPNDRERLFLVIEPAASDPGEVVIPLTNFSRSPAVPSSVLVEDMAEKVDDKALTLCELAQQGADTLLPSSEEGRKESDQPALADTTAALDLPLPEAAERSLWDMSIPPEVLVTQQQREARTAGGRHLWLWLAALVMTGLAAASVAHTGLWDRVQPRFNSIAAWMGLSSPASGMNAPAPVPGPGDTERMLMSRHKNLPEPMQEPRPAAAERGSREPSKLWPEPAAGAAVQASTRAEDGLPSSPSPARPEQSLQVLSKLGQTSLIIPIRGSAKGAVSYMLANPDGLAINLPRARSALRLGSHMIPDGRFRMIWVRRRGDGLQVRVFFRGTVPKSKLDLVKGRVQISLSEPLSESISGG